MIHKRTIFTNSGLGLLQMASEADTKLYASEVAGPNGVDCEIPRRLEKNKTFFIRVWNLSLVDSL